MRGDRGSENRRKGRVLLVAPIIVATMAACAAIATPGWTVVALIVAALIGLAALVLLIDDLLLGFGALFLVATAGIMATSLETPLIGGTLRGIRVAEAAARRAAVYHFVDGHVLRSATRSVPIYGATRNTHHLLYTLDIAPVVGEDWTPDRPVTLWAATSPRSADMPSSDWSRDARAGVRVVANADELRAAIPAVEREFGLRSAPDAVLIHWLDDPEAAMAGERERLAWIAAVLIGLWGVMVLVRRVAARAG